MQVSQPENHTADARLQLANNSAHVWWTSVPAVENEVVATIGACEFGDNDSASDFLKKVVAWLKTERNATLVFGPMDGNTWRSHRAMTYSDGRPPFFMEPNTPQEWPAIFEQAGFAPYSEYTSSVVDLTDPQPDFTNLESRLSDAGVSIRCIDMENFENDLKAIFQLSLESFQHNVLYTPITEEEFLSKYSEAKQLIDPDFVQIAEAAGEVVGFMFSFPDPVTMKLGNKPAIIMKTLATRLERRFSGLGSLLVNRVQEAAISKGFEESYHALQHASNKVQRLSERFNPVVFRRYTLYSIRP